MATWFEGMLGRVLHDGQAVELAGGLNFISPLVAELNVATGVIDVSFGDASETRFAFGDPEWSFTSGTDEGEQFLDIATDGPEVNAPIVRLRAIADPFQSYAFEFRDAVGLDIFGLGVMDRASGDAGELLLRGQIALDGAGGLVRVAGGDAGGAGDHDGGDIWLVPGQAANNGVKGRVVIDGDGLYFDGAFDPMIAIGASGTALNYGHTDWTALTYFVDEGGSHAWGVGEGFPGLRMSLNDTALNVFADAIVSGFLSIGESPAGFGGVRLEAGSAGGAWSNNSAGDNSVLLIALESGNTIFVGGSGTVAGVSSPGFVIANAITEHEWRIANATRFVLDDTDADFQNLNVSTTGRYLHGAAPAAAGKFGVSYQFDWYVKDSGGTDRLLLDYGVGGTDFLRFGNNNTGLTQYFSGDTHQFLVNSATQDRIGEGTRGFYGVTPITRQQITASGVSAADLLAALHALGLVESI
jgi:hypothetical protein